MRSVRTSLSHPLQIDELSIDGIDGILGLTLCPGKTDPYGLTASWRRGLTADMEVIAEWGASVVVSLIEDSEFDLLQVPDLGPAVERSGMTWYHLPIRDVMAPGDAFERRWGEKGKSAPALQGWFGKGRDRSRKNPGRIRLRPGCCDRSGSQSEARRYREQCSGTLRLFLRFSRFQ